MEIPASRLGITLLSLLLLSCGDPQDSAVAAPVGVGRTEPAVVADLVFRNGRLYTLDPERSWAEAVAIGDGRILQVGSAADVDAFIGADTEVVDLEGRMMLPGLQDSHIHPISSGIDALVCDLSDLNGLADYRAAILAYATANPDVPWILGGGWAMSVFGPGAMPSRLILDELVPNRPVYLTSQDGHTGWANSQALQMAGITRDTPDPVDGRIDRDPATGEAIGSLQEGAMRLVRAQIPPTTPEQTLAGLQYSQTMLNGYGITALQDASVDDESLQAYTTLQERQQLRLHVVGAIWWERDQGLEQIAAIEALRARYTAGLIDAGTVKIMQDGVMENYTAAMLQPYLIPGGASGIPMIEPRRLAQIVSQLDQHGFQVHFHAIGDAAIRQSLDAIEQARNDNGALGHRHHISHLQIIDPADIPRFAALDVIANFQPLWAYADEYVTELTLPFIREETARWMYPMKSVLDSGAMLAFGSDWSVSSANPYAQIETAILRKNSNKDDDTPFIPQERIDLATAIAAFTINAAFVNRLEQDTGSIEVGKLADLVVLDQNLFEIAPERISETRAVLTLFAGQPVHGRIADL